MTWEDLLDCGLKTAPGAVTCDRIADPPAHRESDSDGIGRARTITVGNALMGLEDETGGNRLAARASDTKELGSPLQTLDCGLHRFPKKKGAYALLSGD